MLHSGLPVGLGEYGLATSSALSLAKLISTEALKCPEGEASFCLGHMLIDAPIGGILVRLILVDRVIDLLGQLAIFGHPPWTTLPPLVLAGDQQRRERDCFGPIESTLAQLLDRGLMNRPAEIGQLLSYLTIGELGMLYMSGHNGLFQGSRESGFARGGIRVRAIDIDLAQWLAARAYGRGHCRQSEALR